jgi:methionyl-tRNA formyltransferase
VRLVVTAGFNGALHAVGLAELAVREGHSIAAVLVVSPFRVSRLRALIRQRGATAVRRAARRLLGKSQSGSPDEAIERYLADHGIRERTLSAWCASRSVLLRTVTDLNDAAAVEVVQASGCDGVVYAGGGILRKAFIDAAGGRILNPHSGPLPQIRGMNACEWALLLGHPPTVTVHFIDAGVDTGAIVEAIPIPLECGDTIETLRAQCVIAGIEGVLRAIPRLRDRPTQQLASALASRQCFTLAPVLRELLESRLEARALAA